jgi:redox-sensitive bicupin YhaK (pirin superfamily)
MKKVIHKAATRGTANHGWLKSYHTFSFANYQDSERMNFGMLRVLNDDIVQPKMGFGKHPHRNMEIISIPISGALSHKDNMGNKRSIDVGEVQVMSSGTGLTHSEFNDSKTDAVNFL